MDLINSYINQLELIDIVDIALVALAIYAALFLIRGTRAVQVLRGLILLILPLFFLQSIWAQLRAFNWLIDRSLPALILAIPVIFQPELRRVFEQLGRSGSYLRVFGRKRDNPLVAIVKETCTRLSQRRHGALIVFELDTGLQEYIDTGTQLHAQASPELLLTIFNKHTELHDGAVIIRGERIAAAACVMPLSTSSLSDRSMGLRHRASLGISEVSDAVAVVVSEETGQVSIAQNGRIIRQDLTTFDQNLQTFLSKRRRGGSPS